MSAIESDAKPYLIPLIRGEDTQLCGVALLAVSKWIALKVIVSEHDNPKHFVTPEDDRRRFADDGTIPDYFDIRIAAHSLDTEVGYIRHTQTVTISTPDGSFVSPESTPIKNMQDVQFIIGRLLVVAGASRSNIKIDEMFGIRSDALPRIWPNDTRELNWPPLRILGLPEVRSLSARFDAFQRLNRPLWRQHPSDPIDLEKLPKDWA